MPWKLSLVKEVYLDIEWNFEYQYVQEDLHLCGYAFPPIHNIIYIYMEQCASAYSQSHLYKTMRFLLFAMSSLISTYIMKYYFACYSIV